MPVLCAQQLYLNTIKFAPIDIAKSASALQNSISTPFKPKTQSKLCYCSTNEDQQLAVKGFSALEFDPPWESGSVWSNMALYFFSLHVPLSFGGLSVVAQLLDQPNLRPQTKVVALLVIETLEFFGALLLLQFTAKPPYKPVGFKFKKTRSERSWVLASVLGFLVLAVVIYFTSLLSDRLFVSEDVNNQVLKEVLMSNIISQTACTLLYCVVAPLLEEIIYRGFLLTSLAPTMKWHQAVILSSVIFSASHLSGQNFIQLFIIGVLLGCSYCWTGDLRSSILLHSMYNALTLVMTFLA